MIKIIIKIGQISLYCHSNKIIKGNGTSQKMLEMFVIHEQISFSSNKKIHSLRMKGYAQVTFKKLGNQYNQTG